MKIVITLSRKDLINPSCGFDDVKVSKFNIDYDLVLKAHEISFVDDDGRYAVLKSKKKEISFGEMIDVWIEHHGSLDLDTDKQTIIDFYNQNK